MKTTSFDIYSTDGFIGFVAINENQQHKQGTIILFETIEINDCLNLYQSVTKQLVKEMDKSDKEIIGELIKAAIPSFNTNGLKYRAIDISGNSINI